MKLRPVLLLGASLSFLALTIAADAGAVLYKWTDENGRVVYGDQPPPTAKPERLNATVSPADPSAVRNMAAKDAEIKKRQQQRADDEAKAEKDQAFEKRKLDQCAQARGRIRTLREDPNVYQYNDKSEKVYLQQADRDKTIADTEKLMRDLSCPAG
jgi:hypothetical protein